MMTQRTLSIERDQNDGADLKQPPKQFYGLYPKAPPVIVYLFLIGSTLFVGFWLLLTISLSTVNLTLACLAMFGAVILGWLFRNIDLRVDRQKDLFRDTQPAKNKCRNRMADLKYPGPGTFSVGDRKHKKSLHV